ncbi:MAG: helix-turn-helix domain-containing protein [Oscillospiraceae bacterium]|nr:helix-turn-helix domain-containing protein [Oscillospiraceae bacterium]
MTPADTGKIIKTLREERSWTQAELARRLCMTRNGVNSWEQGLSLPSLPMLVQLSYVFSVSSDYLLGLDHLKTIDVSGLNDKDVALLADLAVRLRGRPAE